MLSVECKVKWVIIFLKCFDSQVCPWWRSKTLARDRRPGGRHSTHSAHQPRKCEHQSCTSTMWQIFWDLIGFWKVGKNNIHFPCYAVLFYLELFFLLKNAVYSILMKCKYADQWSNEVNLFWFHVVHNFNINFMVEHISLWVHVLARNLTTASPVAPAVVRQDTFFFVREYCIM